MASPAACGPDKTCLATVDITLRVMNSHHAERDVYGDQTLGGLPVTLNERALRLADYLAGNAQALRIQVHTTMAGARMLDCGIKTSGGLQAGLALARVCLAGQAELALVPGEVAGVACPSVVVTTDNPVLAC